ncbi:type I glyceraldehyde-3-phosphate dehydrogenase [bacterium]|nr:type I glyceraldehyde-3-phosphate dehydrogenase [bacterium]
MSKKIAINGFGRIGKTFLRAVLSDPVASQELDIVAINSGPGDVHLTAHFFKYDSSMGTYPEQVSMENNVLCVGGKRITILTESDPLQLPWKTLEVDWVVEATGRFILKKDVEQHLHAGAKAVLITAPSSDPDCTIIPGVNDHIFDKTIHKVVSLGSCTTNALVPLLHVLHETFSLTSAAMTTVHSYTNNQVLLDVPGIDVRRSRAAALNMIPTTTGAMKVIGTLLPELAGKVSGLSLRVPVAKVSFLDLSFTAKEQLSKDAIYRACVKAQTGALKNIIEVTDKPLVSSDFAGNSHSAIVDGLLIDHVEGIGKLFAWYDNEWGYSCRLRDFLVNCE